VIHLPAEAMPFPVCAHNTCTKLRTALGASLGHSSTSKSPSEVRSTTCMSDRQLKRLTGKRGVPPAAVTQRQVELYYWINASTSTQCLPCPLWAAQACKLETSRLLQHALLAFNACALQTSMH
jgi:hypothetical protein